MHAVQVSVLNFILIEFSVFQMHCQIMHMNCVYRNSHERSSFVAIQQCVACFMEHIKCVRSLTCSKSKANKNNCSSHANFFNFRCIVSLSCAVDRQLHDVIRIPLWPYKGWNTPLYEARIR